MKRSRLSMLGKAVGLALVITFLLHFFVLLLMAGVDAFGLTSEPAEKLEISTKKIFLFSFISIFLFFFMELSVAFGIQGSSRRYKGGWLLLAVFVAALILNTLSIFGYQFLSQGVLDLNVELTSPRFYVERIIISSILSFIVMLISYSDFITRKERVTALMNESLKTQSIQSRYEVLKNQVDPHFLFNTLSSLTSMIEIDPEKAQEFSIKMSSVLRYTLSNKDVVTLEEEMAIVSDYCELMQIRYDKNLTVNFEIDPSYSSSYVVPLCVQSLIENAVKHNEISNRSPLIINVHTNKRDDTLTVSNSINAKRDNTKNTGLGLANLSERYKLKWQREVQIYSNEKVFMVTIPLVPSKHEKHESRNNRG